MSIYSKYQGPNAIPRALRPQRKPPSRPTWQITNSPTSNSALNTVLSSAKRRPLLLSPLTGDLSNKEGNETEKRHHGKSRSMPLFVFLRDADAHLAVRDMH